MDKLYPFKHWLFTMFLAPVVITLYSHIIDEGISLGEFLRYYPFLLVCSFILSIPAIILYYFVFDLIPDNRLSLLSVKWIMNGFAILCVLTIAYILNGNFIPELTIGYCTTIIIGSWFISIKSKILPLAIDEDELTTKNNA